MADSIDITQITDTTQLKAMAYDQILISQQAQSNVAQIEARIREVEAESRNSEH